MCVHRTNIYFLPPQYILKSGLVLNLYYCALLLFIITKLHHVYRNHIKLPFGDRMASIYSSIIITSYKRRVKYSLLSLPSL